LERPNFLKPRGKPKPWPLENGTNPRFKERKELECPKRFFFVGKRGLINWEE